MTLTIGIVDTGVNAWHSHVRGAVQGCRIFATADGRIDEDDDFRDPNGHGTAIAGVIREAFPDALLFAVRVFDDHDRTYASLVARGVLRAAAAGCTHINLSLAMPPGPGAPVLAAACAAALDAGCVLVAPADPLHADALPAALAGVHVALADDSLPPGSVRRCGPTRLAAPDRPRDLTLPPHRPNLRGTSFACARVLVHLVQELRSQGQGLGDQAVWDPAPGGGRHGAGEPPACS
jgi:subtilisin family serine protease